jgi:hypothetical protein
MNENMTEISVDEQRDIRGGDWYDTAFGLIEGLLIGIGML